VNHNNNEWVPARLLATEIQIDIYAFLHLRAPVSPHPPPQAVEGFG
ncbi:uncharacterized protein METZ01_LOCUS317633, partial [marine metagenome]